MAVRYYCDRCGKDVTDEAVTSAVSGIKDADADGGGEDTDNFDHLCSPCYRQIIAFIESPADACPACTALAAREST